MATGKQYSKINIEVSNICNLQCSFCPEVIRPKALMPLGLFRKIIDEVAPLTELVCFHLMGDPLVHPELREFLDVCYSKGVGVFFVTNGVLLKEKSAELLLHPALHQVSFSLHSFSDNFPGQDLSGYLNRIFSYTERAFIQRPELYLNYRLWNLKSQRDTSSNTKILEQIEERFGVQVGRNPEALRFRGKKVVNRLYLHFDTEFIWPHPDLPVLGTVGTCHGLSSHFGILVDGTVVPCCLDKEAVIPLGNIQTASIEEILESERAVKIRKGFEENRLVEDLCQRCQYITRFPVQDSKIKKGVNLSAHPSESVAN